jgi:hypothetical protein
LLGLAGESNGADTVAQQQLPLLEALLLVRMSGDLPRHPITGPDLRSPQHQAPMAGRAMATAPGPTRAL